MTDTRKSSRAQRDKKTVTAMIRIYCAAHHGRHGELCSECRGLLEYSCSKIENCQLLGHKPTCAKCRIHCYDAVRREHIRQVMRYSGPRMIYRHPILAIRHLMD